MKFKRFFVFALLNLCMMTLPMAALATYIVGPISEEQYGTCDIGDAIYGVSCSGSYCDNTELFCADTNVPVYGWYWTTYFSEENNNNWRSCGTSEIMTGLACSGAYCDNVSILCSYIDKPRYNCGWVGPYSEEDGVIQFGNNKYASGMWCTGPYCDNHFYLICSY